MRHTGFSGQTLYTYDAVGNRESVSYPSGNVTLYDYDALNRLTRLTTTDAADQILADYAYTLDATGRRTQVQEAHSGRTTSYSYDELYRLTGETITDPVNGNHSAEYQFDKVGNRTYSIINGVHTAYSYDNNDRLTQQGGVSYSYDANGNTLTETEDGQVTRYHYDARNKPIEVEKGATTTGYAYNADGIRTQKTENGITTHYVVDSNRDYAQVLAEVTNGTAEVSYTYGDDLVSQTRAGSASYYLYDGHGSTRALADGTGSLTDSYDYDAFGVLLNSSGDTENVYRYTGEQLDPSLDQYYLRARYYDQGIGRFTQMDTWMGNHQDPMTLNKYLYANADPVEFTDPSGHFSLGSFGASTSIQGILATSATKAAGFSLVAIGVVGGVEHAAGGDRRWSLWDIIATNYLRSEATTEVRTATTTRPRTRRPDGHHTIPIYLCGAQSQQLSYFDRSRHAAIHTGLSRLQVALHSAEEAADKYIPFTRRRTENVMSLAETEQGRYVIANAIEGYYTSFGWWGQGEPTIGSIFPSERRAYVKGKTSLPDCKRSR